MPDHVAILMGTYQGEEFLPQQLTSLQRQTHTNWSLWVSDDGSTDRTLDIVEQFSRKADAPVHTLEGPRRGFLPNFMALLARPEIDADYYAFCDQDDLWHDDKIEHALAWLKAQPAARPALFCSRTRIVDHTGAVTGFSPLFRRPPSFANALVQSIAGGNTMVMNRAARDLIVRAGADVTVPSHDWWSYILVSGAGGSVHYDPVPKIDYRQHGANQVGSNSGLRARLRRIKMLKDGRFKRWSEQHIKGLEPIEPLLTPENRKLLELFQTARSAAFPANLRALRAAGLYRQTVPGNIGLTGAVLLRQI
ncbi:glycosyltransferase involved in cell wall biosynthesis [Neorhizobium galegae]|uniref:glycosyltransferase family 2 protein n=1 Tax=Neorhizobium galegae TaxID=399 RepID=UPI001AE36DBE|nr:glycosyltransferase family 2 protein [Neorhizobium galegae]MBP2547686.1 glycosyltransferase involved in cell wall biosynthesis [Neorhizobium galegae]